MSKDSESLTSIKLSEIERLIKEFKEKFEIGTSDEENFITINEIERLWGDLQSGTNKVYSEMIRELMSSVDERVIIRKKKGNTILKG
jgi:hypothetical protein